MPKVAIIIINWHGIRDTLECLASLRKISYVNYKVIVVDNGSGEEDITLLEQIKDKNIQIIFNKQNLGFAEANNIAIGQVLKDTKVKYICTLNNDTVVDSKFLDEVIYKIQNTKYKIPIGMTAMRIMKYNEPSQVDSLGIALTQGGLAFNILNTKYEILNTKLFCPCAGAALYSRQLLEKVGLFDSDFFCYAEDLDLGWRARLQGFNCLLANKAIVYHKGSASTNVMSDTAVYHTYRNIIWTLTKNLPGLLFAKYLAKIITGQLAITLLYFCRKKPKLILKAYWHGLSGMPKMLSKRKNIQRKVSIKELEKHIVFGLFLKSYLKKLF